MKGVIFTELLRMVEEKYGLKMVDDIIQTVDLPSKGVYTTVGTYPYFELEIILLELVKRTEIPLKDLIKGYGFYLFGRFSELYPQIILNVFSTFFLLERLESFIHQDVHKLYPEAETPRFSICVPDEKQPNKLEIIYSSKHKLADLAEGLIEGAAFHFKENITVEREDFAVAKGAKAKFTLTKHD